jgi:hypothetical protein
MNAKLQRLISRQTTIVAAAALVSPFGSLIAGGVYKSVDAQGHVVYSDQPDMSVPQTQVDLQGVNSYSDLEVQSNEIPPSLPDGIQPPCPEDGYIWTPGFWAWNSGSYYWVFGDWVAPPRIGLLWTPGYWEYVQNVYVFHVGYWASEVGYYGGIDYGFGYFGVGYSGGRWVGNAFAYNRAVSNLGGRPFRSVYSEAIRSGSHSRLSFNGPGGTPAIPTAQERARIAEAHLSPTLQQRHDLVEARHTAPGQSFSGRTAQSPAGLNRPAYTPLPRPYVSNVPARPEARSPNQPIARAYGAPTSSSNVASRPRASTTHSAKVTVALK